jgi:hypothetical protein
MSEFTNNHTIALTPLASNILLKIIVKRLEPYIERIQKRARDKGPNYSCKGKGALQKSTSVLHGLERF